MRLPDPFKGNRFPQFPRDMDPRDRKKLLAVDGKIRMHNLARYVARLPDVDSRRRYVRDMAKKHKPPIMTRFSRLVKWYWRSQRAKSKN